ncbi:MAG: carbohydrate ABC transporter permease [Cellulosilyticum sp.]|nr:carbohydrate ABC transporter permease [Cellulosilyticum sp.]
MSIGKKIENIILTFIKYFSLCLGAFIAVIPVVVCLFTAFKTDEEYATTNVMQLPQSWTYLENFKIAWTKAKMFNGFKNTFIIMIVVVCGSIMIGAMLAYVLNRFKFPGNALIRNLFLFATLIPGVATQVTVYQIMHSLGFINKIYGYIILMLGTDVISIYVFLQFFENISVSLDESAIMDGCTYYGVFIKILLPLLKPAMVTCMILKGVGIYNEYYCSNLYIPSQTISTALYTFTGPYGSQYNYICAGVIITIIPALIIFICCQKQIYSGLAAGAVKG